MSPNVLWFHVMPAYAMIVIAVIAYIVTVRFFPSAIRRRDKVMITALTAACVIWGFYAFAAFDAIAAVQT